MFKVYSASAGSGKTYNLVLDYLTACFKRHLHSFLKLKDKNDYQCEHCAEYQHILAITFTNNAGAEMKDRVVKQLNKLAFAKTHMDIAENDFQNLCKKVFGENLSLPTEDAFIFFNRTSKALLHSVLYDYARFSITTIDSFIQRLIRSSALYLNLSMNYVVQIHLTDFFRMAIEQYICDLSNNKQQFEVVVQELSQQLEDKGSANIHRFLTNSLNILYKDTEKSHPFVKNILETSDLLKIVNNWKKKHHTIENACKKQLQPLCDQAISIFESAESEGISTNQTMKWDKWFQNITNDPFDTAKGMENSRFVKGMNREKIFKAAKGKNDLSEANQEHYIAQIEGIFQQMQDIVMPMAKTYYSCRALSKSANYLLVLNDLTHHIETIKEQTDTFFLSESNPLVNDEIHSDTQGEPLFEKLSFYQTFFIDEFQDTSLMQWQDLKPMLINALGEENGNITLFGDVKQSIYRFRNGDVNLFYHLMDENRLKSTASEQDIAQLLSEEQPFYAEQLNTNYRSREAVISFNNRFFEFYAQQLGKSDYYSDVTQITTPEKDGGLVQIYTSHSEKPFKDLRNVWSECPENYYQNVYLSLRPEEADLIYAVMDAKKRGYGYGDMAVLLRGRAKCNSFAQQLMAAGVPVVTSDSLQLCDNPGVGLVISTLRMIINPTDKLSQSLVLQYLAQKYDQPWHSVLEKTTHYDFYEFVETAFHLTDFRKIISQWIKNPFLLTMKEIVRFYEYQREMDPFIADFLDLVNEYAQTQAASIAGFLDWWDDLHLSGETIPRLSLSGAKGAVQLMTIHVSKGLEFPVVITLCNNIKAQPTSYWVQDTESGQNCYVTHEKNLKYSDFEQEFEEEEDKRLLDVLNLWYVDFTRARDMLYILTTFPERESQNNADIRSYLQQFVNESDENVYYFGQKDWQNPKKQADTVNNDSGFRSTCSDMTFYNSKTLKVIPSGSVSDFIDTGTRIHECLQKLISFPSSEEEINAVLDSEPENIQERLRFLFKRTAEDAHLRPYFYVNEEDKVLNEVSIITESGELKRPDRIIIKPDHVMIVDYKTGKEYQSKYEAQLAEYQSYMQKMGYQDVRTEILYIEGEKC